jgi:hypothetical protein
MSGDQAGPHVLVDLEIQPSPAHRFTVAAAPDG